MSNPEIKLPVKKGDKLLIEVEFQKDMDLYTDSSILIQSLYGKECIINDEFKVTRILPKRDINDIRNFVIARLEGLIEDVELL